MDNSFPIQLAIRNWDAQNKHFTKILGEISDEQMLQPIAPGKNTGRYLLGHLVAVHDYFHPLFGIGEQLFPEIVKLYIRTPDDPSAKQPSVAELRQMNETVVQTLSEQFATFSDEDWLSRHMLVSEEDFVKEPHRNKLDVLNRRACHLAYHVGQLILLSTKGD